MIADETHEYLFANSPLARTMSDHRRNSRDGKIDRILGSEGPITEEFKTTIKSGYHGILENPHLDKEIEAFKKILRALKGSNDARSGALFDQLRENPVERSTTAPLCPIWRHERAVEVVTALTRYFFPEVKNELFMMTVVFDFSPNLLSLADSVEGFLIELRRLERAFTKRKRGLVLVGSLEPDLKSPASFSSGRDLGVAAVELDWQVPDHGGWVLSGHFIGRATFLEEFKTLARKTFPSESWRRVRFDPIREKDGILKNVMTIFNYMNKFNQLIFPVGASRGEAREKIERTMREVQSAFLGPTLQSEPKAHPFDWAAAIRTWALFVDMMGDRMTYSVENVHAQKWQSQPEMQFFRHVDEDWVHGWNRIELHRDVGPFRNTIDPRIRHLVPYRRTRRLRFDQDWFDKTDRYKSIDPWSSSLVFPVFY